MRVIILGPPGSGKSTHARLLAERLSVAHLSVGAALREEVAEGTSLGLRIAAKVAAGELVEFADVLAVLVGPLEATTTGGGWVLDGAPRTITQAEVLDSWLDELQAPADCVVALDVPEGELRERLLRRGRPDDTPEVVSHRLAVWQHEGADVLAWYQEKGRLVRVDGVGEAEAVACRVTAAVEQAARN